jgi:uncharacterized protein with FMN-binding domain
MRRIVLGFMSTVTVLVLLFGYHTSTSSRRDGESAVAAPIGGAAAPSTADPSTPAPSTAGPSSAAPSAATPSSAAPSAGSAAAKTVTGDSADTRWGPVQVRITVQSRKVTAVKVVDYPTGSGRDREINAYALPILVKETLSAQSADIDMVSGATVTSDGYVRSLQSALDQAGI